MVNLLIAYDNVDQFIGEYLHKCYSDLEETISQIIGITLISLDGEQCTTNFISKSIATFNETPFIFIGYSHGRQDALLASHVKYISNDNMQLFHGSFFYTTACLSAIQLGPDLLDNGCLAYIGYDREVKVVPQYESIFIKCKNSGMKFFLQGNKTIKETQIHMLAIYEDEVSKLNSLNDESFIAASFLRSNMISLVVLGNNITLNDLVCEE